MDRQELLGTLAAKWGRQLTPYLTSDDPVYGVFSDEALTGFACILDPPKIGEFRNEKCVLLPLARWLLLNYHASNTVTPFRVVAVGESVIVAAWRPLTGMKYAARATKHGIMVHIPISEFDKLA